MRCSNCNADVPPDLHVCGACGTPIAPPLPAAGWNNADTNPSAADDAPTPPNGTNTPPPVPQPAPTGGLQAMSTQAPGQPPGQVQGVAPPAQPAATGLADEKTPVPAPGASPFNRPDSSGGQSGVGTRVVQMDPQTDRGTRIVDINLPPMVRKARQKMNRSLGTQGRTFKRGALDLDESDISRGMDEFNASMKLFYKRLHRFDRWAVWVLMLAFLGAFFPWSYELGIGLVSGVQGLFGMGTAALAMLTFLWIYLRTARRRLGPAMLMLQIVTATGLMGMPLYQLFSTELLDFRFGIYFCTTAAGAVVALTLARLTRINV